MKCNLLEKAMKKVSIDNYFKMSERQQFELQAKMFNYCALYCADLNSHIFNPTEQYTIQMVTDMVLEEFIEKQEFEIAQCVKDMSITYGIS